MPRAARYAPDGFVYHALNRAVARLPLFENSGDYDAFERVLMLAVEKHPIRVLAYCLMPNHWHFVLWPNLVKRAEDWRRQNGDEEARSLLSAWPLPEPSDWVRQVNAAQTEAESTAPRRSVSRGSPFGGESWTKQTARRLGLETTLRPRGRPAKGKETDG